MCTVGTRTRTQSDKSVKSLAWKLTVDERELINRGAAILCQIVGLILMLILGVNELPLGVFSVSVCVRMPISIVSFHLNSFSRPGKW